ncbi:Vacuolar protein sorting-associated protein 27 [Diplonema papillatum]|nr:Vacuolar protein sorting-associated protein 27 [Diplonema papillatum]KAJ9456572.1 Vacuolar protein sorting-associated protein 27 [Diplonema papillatum]
MTVLSNKKRPIWVESTACGECNASFTFFDRRHHCRVCGGAVCDRCSRNRKHMPASFGYSSPQRVCNCCVVKSKAKSKQPPAVRVLSDRIVDQEAERRLAVMNAWLDHFTTLLRNYMQGVVRKVQAESEAGDGSSSGRSRGGGCVIPTDAKTTQCGGEKRLTLKRTDLAEKIGLVTKGLTVTDVEPNGVAMRSGGRDCVGMRLTHVNSQFVSTPEEARIALTSEAAPLLLELTFEPFAPDLFPGSPPRRLGSVRRTPSFTGTPAQCDLLQRDGKSLIYCEVMKAIDQRTSSASYIVPGSPIMKHGSTGMLPYA